MTRGKNGKIKEAYESSQTKHTLVEDDENSELIAYNLEKENYKVTCASSDQPR